MTTQSSKHVFISYVRENQKEVDRLCKELESHGVNVWLDRDDITAGIFWKDAIRKAIKEGAFFIACFSTEYASRTETYANEELNLAIEVLRKRPREQAWFIPVVISGEVPDWEVMPGRTLQDIQWVSLHDDWNAGIQRILSVIKPIPPKIQILIYALRSENIDVRREAAYALSKIGPEAKTAITALIETLKDPEERVRRAVAQALGRIGAEDMPALIEAFKDPEKSVRQAVAQALGIIGTEAIPILIEALIDKDGDVRQATAQALASIGPEAKDAVPALVEALKDQDKDVRRSAAEALFRSGREAKAAVPVLIEALKDEDTGVRRSIADALCRIGPAALRGSDHATMLI